MKPRFFGALIQLRVVYALIISLLWCAMVEIWQPLRDSYEGYVLATGTVYGALVLIPYLPSFKGTFKPMALALLLAITVGCAAATPERDPAARVAEMQQVLQEAQSTAAELQDKEFRSLALWVIVLWQTEARDVRGALATATTIERAFDKASALGAIAEAQAMAGDHAGAARTVEQARQATNTIDDASRKADALSSIAEAQAKAGDVRGALATATTIENASSKASALGAIAEAQAMAGDHAGAARTFEQARQATNTFEYASRKAYVLSSIAAAQLTAKDSEGATRTYYQALEAATAITEGDFLSKAIAVALIAADLADAGDVQGTLAWAAARSGDPVAKVSALVGVVVGVLQPTGRSGETSRSDPSRLLPRRWNP